MDFLGIGISVLSIKEDNVLFIILPIIVVIVVLAFMSKILKLYLKNIELGKDKEKNSKEIQENLEKISVLSRKTIKVSAIIFSIVIITLIILSNFIQF